jgi:ADP-heptose:LPS heptosyltransferase
MCAGRVEGVERLLVLRANGLGDLVVAEPALTALRAAYPGAEIVLAGATHAAALFNNRPAPVDRVELAPRVPGVRFDAGGAERIPDDAPEVVEAFCARMRAEGFDLAVQLHGGGGNANPLLRRFGARVTAGSRAPGAPPLDRTVPYHPFQHDVLRWLEVVGLVGADPVRLSPRLAVTAEDLAAADAALSAAGLQGCGRDPAPPGPAARPPRGRRARGGC